MRFWLWWACRRGRNILLPVPCPNAFLFTQSIVGSSVGNYRESLEVKGLAQRGVIRFCVEVERLRDLQGVFEI
jgi:hypothetical protein